MINTSNISISEKTKQKRDQLRKRLDDYCTFAWNGVDDPFQVFGAFIVSNNSLKFYNGSSFSNTYSSPQFDSNTGDLTGISFQKQSISFTIGVYWINSEQYQWLLQWLNAYDVDYLTFSFNPKFSYLVKLNSIADSTKYVIGSETNNGKSEDMYYTEIELKFDVLNSYAVTVHDYEFTTEQDTAPNNINLYKTTLNNKTKEFVSSKLDFPFKYYFTLDLNSKSEENFPKEVQIILKAKYTNDTYSNEVELFNLSLQNLTGVDANNKTTFSYPKFLPIFYDSELGLLFYNYGGSYQLLNLLCTSVTGQYIVKSMNVNKFMIPGTFNSSIDWDKFSLELSVSSLTLEEESPNIAARGRTNIA